MTNENKDILYSRIQQRAVNLGDIPKCPECEHPLELVRVLFDVETVVYRTRDYNIREGNWTNSIFTSGQREGRTSEVSFRCTLCGKVISDYDTNIYENLMRLIPLQDVVGGEDDR